jgi:alpha-1,2-rhamnosyltransferase
MGNGIMTRILLDATNTAGLEYNTGIERVVRRVAESAQDVQAELGVSCIPIVCRQGQLLAAPQVAGRSRWDDRLATSAGRVQESVQRACAGSLARCWPWGYNASTNLATRLKKALYPRTLARAASNAYAMATGRSIQLRPTDIVLLIDACWSTPPTLYERARQQGCFVAQVVYDLLPITHRRFFLPNMHDAFKQWLDYALDQVDGFWAISHTVREELLAYQRRRLSQTEHNLIDPAAQLPAERFRAFRLGADLTAISSQTPPRDSIQRIFGQSASTFLTVGTIEPRKNHWWLLAAFNKYWSQGGAANLVLAGRAGWACDEIREAIQNHDALGSKLHWYHDASDGEVQYMYQHARATLFPSFAEGYGLPIIESLHQGTEVLASDTAIHREVGGDRITYFSLDDVDDLVDQLHRTARRQKPQLPSHHHLVPTWRECTRDLIIDVRQLAALGKADQAANPQTQRAA